MTAGSYRAGVTDRRVTGDDDEGRVLGDVLGTSGTSDPADLVVSAHGVRALQDHVDAVLSDLESEVPHL